MNPDFKESILDLSEKLDEEIGLPTEIKSVDEFKNKIASFIVRQLGQIEGLNNLQRKVVKEIENKVDTHALSIAELMSLFSTLGNQKAGSTQVLLDIFKPTATAMSTPLLIEKKENTKDQLDEVLSKFDSNQRMAFLNIFNKITEADAKLQSEAKGETE